MIDTQFQTFQKKTNFNNNVNPVVNQENLAKT